jgi:hypothetical protein
MAPWIADPPLIARSRSPRGSQLGDNKVCDKRCFASAVEACHRAGDADGYCGATLTSRTALIVLGWRGSGAGAKLYLMLCGVRLCAGSDDESLSHRSATGASPKAADGPGWSCAVIGGPARVLDPWLESSASSPSPDPP